jgi:hypothetical protein
MTLHEVIILILGETISGAMTTVEIADELNRRDLYQRRDNQDIPPSQVGARVRQYSHLFINVEGQISLR